MTEPENPQSQSPAAHPLDVLRAEHQVVLAFLDDMEREAVRAAESGRLNRVFWQRALGFYRDYHESMHHQKEEQLLFPALEALGLDASVGPTAVLREEHERGRRWLRRIEHTLQADDATRLAAAITGFVDFHRQHIRKEDQILFPLATQLLTPSGVSRLAAAFRSHEDTGTPPTWTTPDDLPVPGPS